MARLGPLSVKGSGGVAVRVLEPRMYERKDVALKGLFSLSGYKSSRTGRRICPLNVFTLKYGLGPQFSHRRGLRRVLFVHRSTRRHR